MPDLRELQGKVTCRGKFKITPLSGNFYENLSRQKGYFSLKVAREGCIFDQYKSDMINFDQKDRRKSILAKFGQF